jgi:hypothetical protein
LPPIGPLESGFCPHCSTATTVALNDPCTSDTCWGEQLLLV